jgi:cobalamin biosynthesis Mg chelatase CobN
MTATADARIAEEATIAAGIAMTATAEAELDEHGRATQEAESAAMTATAEADAQAAAEADARATEQAISSAMTATAAAQPEPTPTATPEPVAVTGQVTEIRGGQVWVRPDGQEDVVAYTVPADASILRGGERVTLGSVQAGDSVNLTVDGYSQTVRELSATAPAGPGPFSSFAKFLILIPALAVIPLVLFLRGRGGVGDPFVVKRVASA